MALFYAALRASLRRVSFQASLWVEGHSLGPVDLASFEPECAWLAKSPKPLAPCTSVVLRLEAKGEILDLAAAVGRCDSAQGPLQLCWQDFSAIQHRALPIDKRMRRQARRPNTACPRAKRPRRMRPLRQPAGELLIVSRDPAILEGLQAEAQALKILSRTAQSVEEAHQKLASTCRIAAVIVDLRVTNVMPGLLKPLYGQLMRPELLSLGLSSPLSRIPALPLSTPPDRVIQRLRQVHEARRKPRSA